MAWTSLSFSVGQVLTAAQMNNLQANFAALAAGDAGAPDITQLSDLGGVGSFAFCRHTTNNTAITAGTTYSGADLAYVALGLTLATTSVIWDNSSPSGGTPSGTWRALGTTDAMSGYYSATLFVRVS